MPNDATLELQEKVKLAWQKGLRDFLSIVFSGGQLRLRSLCLGWGGTYLANPIPITLLQGIPIDSPVFSELTELCIVEVFEGEHAEAPQNSSTVATTRTLKDFIALAPKLTTLDYRGALGIPW